MPVLSLTATDFLGQFLRLLPRGRIWFRGWGSIQAEALLTLMPMWVRLNDDANELISEAFPCTTSQMLPEWEASLGLPDPCTGPLPTLQQRTAAVCAKFTARGGSSMEYFIHLAASLGYEISIETYKPFYASQGRAGDPLYDASWAYAWNVIVYSASTITRFRASISAAGEPLASWGNQLLQCAFAAYAPAHTVPIWSYKLDGSLWDVLIGNSVWDLGDSHWDRGAVIDA